VRKYGFEEMCFYNTILTKKNTIGKFSATYFAIILQNTPKQKIKAVFPKAKTPAYSEGLTFVVLY